MRVISLPLEKPEDEQSAAAFVQPVDSLSIFRLIGQCRHDDSLEEWNQGDDDELDLLLSVDG